MRRIVVLLAVVLLLLVGCVTPDPGVSPVATPSYPLDVPPDPGNVPTLPDFLEMLSGPAGWVLLGAVISQLFVKWPWYNMQPGEIKRGLIILASIVCAVGARLLLTYVPASFWQQTAAYWYIVAGVILTWLGSQGWYQGVVKPSRERELL